MAYCKDCVHFPVCQKHVAVVDFPVDDGVCLHFATSEELRPKGRWIRTHFVSPVWKCSECNTRINRVSMIDYYYCPNCGAKMEVT